MFRFEKFKSILVDIKTVLTSLVVIVTTIILIYTTTVEELNKIKKDYNELSTEYASNSLIEYTQKEKEVNEVINAYKVLLKDCK